MLHKDWDALVPLLNEAPLKELKNLLKTSSYTPCKENIFRVFQKPINHYKVVILGQDPYPTPGHANGLAFSVNSTVKGIPASLRVIKGELTKNLGNSYNILDSNIFNNIDEWKTLNHWEDQGIMLLNTALTTFSGQKASHLKYWKPFIAQAISLLSSKNPCIWLLWGKKSQEFMKDISNAIVLPNNLRKEELIEILVEGDSSTNYILKAPHPAAEMYSGRRKFTGCGHFMTVNQILDFKLDYLISF